MRPFEPLGDRALGVFSPSSPFDEARFEAGCARLRNLGFTLTVHPQAHARAGFLAGDDAARAAAFAELLADAEVGAVLAARGGYGVARWIDRVDPEAVRAAGKAIVGFSDVSVLHAAAQAAGLESLHGPVVTQLAGLPEADVADFAARLRAPTDGFTLSADGPTLAPGHARGPLVGGCLSMVVSLVGTPHQFVPEGAILLLEEVAEAPYRLDRLLTQLSQAGVLERVAGVALGDFVNCEAPRPNEPEALDVLAERLGGLGVPVLAGLPIGHGARNRAVPLGRTVELDADARLLIVLPG